MSEQKLDDPFNNNQLTRPSTLVKKLEAFAVLKFVSLGRERLRSLHNDLKAYSPIGEIHKTRRRAVLEKIETALESLK